MPVVVVIDGERNPIDPGGYPTASLTATFRCASGDRIPGEWIGVAVETMLDEAGAPSGTTHLLVQGADGYRVCLPLGDVLDGVLAFERRPPDGDGGNEGTDRSPGTESAGADERDRAADATGGADAGGDRDGASGLPRFVAPAISGTRTVKRVERIEPVTLDPAEDPEGYEDLLLGASGEG